MRNIYSNNLNKRAQFFILSAVIIASIIVSLASVKNFATTGDAPKKFYYYSQQLEDETGAVVDYALYNDPTGDNNIVKANLNNFLQQSIDKTLEGYPEMEIFACYTNASVTDSLVCQNDGVSCINITAVNTLTGDSELTIASSSRVGGEICGNKKGNFSSERSIDITNKQAINISLRNGKVYSIDLTELSVQRNQFYFLLKMNTSSGDYIADSTGTNPS